MPMESDGPERYRVRDLLIDVDRAAVTRGAERIVLPPRTFELLVVLARRYPALVRRQELLQAVWADEHVCDETLSHRVMVLRRALGDHSDDPVYVQGERGFGYRLLGPVTRLGLADAGRRSGDRRRGLTRWAAPVVAVLAVVLLALQEPTARGWTPGSPITLAVRPLAAPAGAHVLGPVAKMLTGTIESQLRRLPGIRVVRDAGTGPGPKLRVQGEVSGTADSVEVRLSLVDGASGIQLWTRHLQGSLYETLDTEEGTAWAVAEAVHAQISPDASLPRSPDAASPAVRRLCLRGELAGLSLTEDGTREADGAWSEAVALDPRHAPAHAGYARSAAIRALFGYEGPDGAAERARLHARYAVELDERLAAGHVAAGLVKLLFDRDVAGAESSFARAADLDPDDLTVTVGLALICQARGRYGQSLEYLRTAVAGDSRAHGPVLLEARAQQGLQRWSEAAAAYERLLRLEPGFPLARRGLAECLAAAGKSDEALAALELKPSSPVARLGRDSSERLLRTWQGLCHSAPPYPGQAARACLYAGDLEGAAECLATGVVGRAPWVVFAVHDPLFRPLRGRPVFDDLTAEIPR